MKTNFLFWCLSIIVLIAVLGTNAAQAQNPMDDVVYLKNGSVIRGTIIEQIPNKTIKLQTKDGNIFVYELSEIAKITKEPAPGITRRGAGSQKERIPNTRGQTDYAVQSTSFSFSPLLGFGTNDYSLGFGLRSGAKFGGVFYTGATFIYHTGTLGFHVLYFGGELGYNGETPQIVVQPYASFGLLNDSGWGRSRSLFYVAPAMSFNFLVNEQLSVGPDFKYVILPAFTELNAFIFSLSFSFDFGQQE